MLTNIIPTQVVGCKDAVELAILEEICIKKNPELASKASGRPRVRLYLSTLMQNGKRAAQAAGSCLTSLKHHSIECFHAPSCDRIVCFQIAYYRVRKLVLGRLHPEAQIQHVISRKPGMSSSYEYNFLAGVNQFLSQEFHDYLTALGRRQRLTEAEKEKEEEPAQHDFALMNGTVLAEYSDYVACVALAGVKEGIRVEQEAMRAYSEGIRIGREAIARERDAKMERMRARKQAIEIERKSKKETKGEARRERKRMEKEARALEREFKMERLTIEKEALTLELELV